MMVTINLKRLKEYLKESWWPENKQELDYATEKFLSYLMQKYGDTPVIKIEPDPDSPKWCVIFSPNPLLRAIARVAGEYVEHGGDLWNFWFFALKDTDSPYASALLQVEIESIVYRDLYKKTKNRR